MHWREIKAHRLGAIIQRLEPEGASPVIPEIGRKANDQDHPNFDRQMSHRSTVIELMISWFKESCCVFSRFAKTAINDLGMIHAAPIHTARIRYYLPELLE